MSTQFYKEVLDAWRQTPLAARPFARYYVARHPDSPMSADKLQTWLQKSVEYASLFGGRRGQQRLQRVFHDQLSPKSTVFLDTMYFRNVVKGGRFVLVAIDGFSKRVWFRAMRTLDAKNAVRAFSSIIEAAPGIRRVLTDRGIEFKSKLFAQLLDTFDIRHTFTTSSFPNKAYKAERVILTLRKTLGRLLRLGAPLRLPLLLERAESTINRLIVSNPRTVYESRIERELEAAAGAPNPFLIGDTVLLRLPDRSVFAKSHEPTYGDTLFLVVGLVVGSVVSYQLEDLLSGERLVGAFPPSSLVSASHSIIQSDDGAE